MVHYSPDVVAVCDLRQKAVVGGSNETISKLWRNVILCEQIASRPGTTSHCVLAFLYFLNAPGTLTIRIISISTYNAHTDPLFKKYRILKLPHILQLQQLKCYHKYINKKLPAYLQSIPLKQNKSVHEHLTRSHLKLHITRTNHRFAERCIRNSIPLLVNTMPMEIINKISTHSLQNVARRIKEYYLSSYKERCDILNCYVCQI